MGRSTPSSNRSLLFGLCAALLCLLACRAAEAEDDKSARTEDRGIIVSCPEKWVGSDAPQAKLKNVDFWNEYVTYYSIDDTVEFLGTEIVPPEGTTFQLACQYDGDHWLTVLFPRGRLGRCHTKLTQDGQNRRFSLWCEVRSSEDGALGGVTLYPAEPVTSKTKIGGFAIRQGRDYVSSQAKRNGYIVRSEMKNGDLHKFHLKRGEIEIEIVFSPSHGFVSEVILKNPRYGWEGIDFSVGITNRFGLNYKYVDRQNGRTDYRWESHDGTVAVDLMRSEEGWASGVRIFEMAPSSP